MPTRPLVTRYEDDLALFPDLWHRFGLACLALALLVFTLDSSHTWPVAWIANRNALVAAVPALLGLVAHLRWREQGWRPGLPLSMLGLGVGLLGGEAALGVFAYVGAYELVGARGGCAAERAIIVSAKSRSNRPSGVPPERYSGTVTAVDAVAPLGS